MSERLQKHTLNLFEGDYERLTDLYPEVPVAVVIRGLIRRHIERRDAQTEEVPSPKVTIQL